jgi:hypothetical protein
VNGAAISIHQRNTTALCYISAQTIRAMYPILKASSED